MNNQTNIPPSLPVSLAEGPSLSGQIFPRPLSWWLRKLFACNSFYLVSAALLLFGCYRVSVDAPLFSEESARLLFNFTSVQIYEILLVALAVFLSRRRLWYDSTLLAGLENLLVFVPFILISQAALLDSSLAQSMCAVGGTVAILRFGTLRRYFRELNLPGRLLSTGLALLVINVALPLIFRHFGETKIGVHIESGPAYNMNECTWLLILPAALALANLLLPAKATGNLLPQHRWLPLGMFSLWFIVTGVHLYGLDYIYQFDLRSELFAPAAWVLAWTLWWHVPVLFPRLKAALLVSALLLPLLAAGGHGAYLVLTGLNLVACGVAGLVQRDRLAGHLAYVSVLMCVAGMPHRWLAWGLPGSSGSTWVLAGLVVYAVFWSAWVRNAKLGLLGAFAFGLAIAAVFRRCAGIEHWALQAGMVFLLLHSLRWEDAKESGAAAVRGLTGIAWYLESLAWMNSHTGRFWMPLMTGGLVLGVYGVSFLARGKWRLVVVPATAVLVILAKPFCLLIHAVYATPLSLLAVAGSFLFLAVGTVAALTRDNWQKPCPEVKGNRAPAAELPPESTSQA